MLIYDPQEHPYDPKLDHPLSPRGRFGRLAYLAWYLILSLAIMIPIMLWVVGFFALAETANNSNGMFGGSFIIIFILYIVFFYYAIVITIRRLHDLSQTGWLSLLMFVPLINIGFMLYIMFAKGVPVANQYGAPRPNRGWENILGKIYIGLTVLGIVFAIALVATGYSGVMDQILLDQMEMNINTDELDQISQIDQMMNEVEQIGQVDEAKTE